MARGSRATAKPSALSVTNPPNLCGKVNLSVAGYLASGRSISTAASTVVSFPLSLS